MIIQLKKAATKAIKACNIILPVPGSKYAYALLLNTTIKKKLIKYFFIFKIFNINISLFYILKNKCNIIFNFPNII